MLIKSVIKPDGRRLIIVILHLILKSGINIYGLQLGCYALIVFKNGVIEKG